MVQLYFLRIEFALLVAVNDANITDIYEISDVERIQNIFPLQNYFYHDSETHG